MSETTIPTPADSNASSADGNTASPADSNAATPTPLQLAETPEALLAPPTTLQTPFEHIALAFSGGGFRAASFSLGVLGYLNNCPFTDNASTGAFTNNAPAGGSGGQPVTLLQKIRFISSASGGTITNAAFALAVAEGQSFKEFFDTLYNRLRGDQLMQTALEKLNSNGPWRERPLKGRNLINAFALCYDDMLFDHKTLGHLQMAKSATGMKVPLEEVCFNATEFFRGLPFRQTIKLLPDHSKDPWFFYGNNYIRIGKSVAAQIKIADTMAASSCFPMGFEPLRFPDDFAHDELSVETLHSALQPNKKMLTEEEIKFLDKNNIGLMDGGITDNQGLDSLIIADNRRYRKETSFAPFDLCLVNDVGSQYMEPYCVPPVNKKSTPGKLSYTNLQWVFFLALIGCIALGIVAYNSTNPIGKALLTAGTGLLGGILLITFLLGRYLPGKIIKEGTNNFSPAVISLLLGFFRNTRLSVVMQMLTARVSSAITLNSDVFLKRVRSLIYNNFYENPHWINRRKGNHIYDLSFTNDLNRKQHAPNPDIVPTEAIQTLAQQAYEMPTTLWFDKSEEFSLPVIITCGQFNTCYNLLDYTQRLLSDTALMNQLDAGYQTRVKELNSLFKDHWNKFCIDPFWMLNRTYPGKPLTIDGKNIKYISTT
jgi:hypothetical protein